MRNTGARIKHDCLLLFVNADHLLAIQAKGIGHSSLPASEVKKKDSDTESSPGVHGGVGVVNEFCWHARQAGLTAPYAWPLNRIPQPVLRA